MIGYGDFSAVTWPAQNAVVLMAIVGYLYGLVFLARVVNDFQRTVPKDLSDARPPPALEKRRCRPKARPLGLVKRRRRRPSTAPR